MASSLVGEEMVTRWLDESRAVDTIYLDLAKRIDCVNYRLLLIKPNAIESPPYFKF